MTSTTTHQPSQPDDTANAITGVLLAGGLNRRMHGQNKGSLLLTGQPLIEQVAQRAKPQVAELLLNSNTPLAPNIPNVFTATINDSLPDYPGPLAGILAAMQWCRTHQPHTQWLASFTVDTPFLPRSGIATLLKAATQVNAQYVCAASYGRRHPLFALWPIAQADALHDALVNQGIRKVQAWTDQFSTLEVDFTPTDAAQPDPFFNINTPEDLAEAEVLLGRMVD